jgi:capsular polysaccharide biosynthesis protein
MVERIFTLLCHPAAMPVVQAIRDIAVHDPTPHAPQPDFALVTPAGRSLMRPPLFLLGPAPEPVLFDLAAQIDTPAVGCYTLNDALVAPTGIAIKDGTAFHSEAFLHPRHLVVTISDRVNAERMDTVPVDGTVAVLCGPAHETYGHWLVDFLPRLWVLHQAGYDLATLRYLVPADLRDFAAGLLRLCGIRDEQLVRYQHWQSLLRVEQLLLPTGLRLGDRLAPSFAAATRFWLDRTPCGQGSATARQGVYLTRRQGSERRLVNRERMEAIAAEHGLTVLRPEEMGLSEQIAVFRSAGLIVGEYGSALHNSVFSGAGAIVCALRGTARHPSLVQSGIATAMGQDVAYVFGKTEGVETHQAFCVAEKCFTKALELMSVRQAGDATYHA